MPRRKEGARVLGPYPDRRGWRVVIVEVGGGRASRYRETKAEAEKLAREAAREVVADNELTIGGAIDRYEVKHLRLKGNKETSITTTIIRLEQFFGERGVPLRGVTAARCKRLYEELVAKSATDTHRNMLAESKTFLGWCARESLLPKNPAADIEGTGKRRRGKEQLRIDEARAWMTCALALADDEPGAVAAMMAFLMGLRASEVVSRTVRDLDDGGRLLWIPEAKTEKGKRTVEVPEVLRPHLLQLVDGKQPQDRIFGNHWRDWVRKWVQRICTAAKVPAVTAHGMRGLHATLAEASGVTAHVVAASLGHESATTTHKHYTAPSAVAKGRQDRVLKVIAGGRKG